MFKSLDVGYVWAPYIPSIFKITFPDNYQLSESIMKRYGNTKVNPNYYGHVFTPIESTPPAETTGAKDISVKTNLGDLDDLPEAAVSAQAKEIAKTIDDEFIKEIEIKVVTLPVVATTKKLPQHKRLVSSYTDLQRDEYCPDKKGAVEFLEEKAWSSEVRQKLAAMELRLKEEAKRTSYWDPEGDD